MGKRTGKKRGHTGQTDAGNTRDVKVDRIGRVTIYQRGKSYYLYYREAGKTERRKIDGNLAVARATAGKVTAALEEQQPSPIGFRRTTPPEMVDEYLSYVQDVKRLALRTQDRYRAALDRFLDFCNATDCKCIDRWDENTIDDFVRWLRGQTRARNGAEQGRKERYKVGGVRFILSTCRTAFGWAGRRRMLPPFADNPFSRYAIDSLSDRDESDEGAEQERVFSAEQEREFFEACNEWQKGIFRTLATYGMRVGELVHLLVEDVDFAAGEIRIRSKPELFWRIKTARRRQLPLTEGLRKSLKLLVGKRKAGFVFMNQDFFEGTTKLAKRFDSPTAFRRHVEQIVETVAAENPVATDREKRRAVVAFCRSMGQIPEKRVREEYMRLTERIGCPEFTRVHDLRHLFSTRAQEKGLNPLLVQEILGHSTLEMTRKYTHPGLEVKKAAIESISSTNIA